MNERKGITKEDAAHLHNLIAKLEDSFKRHLEAQDDYFKAREELREYINSMVLSK